MLLLGLLSAAATGTTGCGFNGGAFVGAQGGFNHIEIKRLAKDKAINKDDAKKLVGIFSSVGTFDFKNTATDKDAYNNTKTFEGTTYRVKVDLTDAKSAAGDDLKAAGQKIADAIKAATLTADARQAKTVEVVLLQDGTKADFSAVAANLAATDALKALSDNKAQEKTIDALVASEAEAKYKSNNGFVGVHAGYLGRVNDKFLAGGLVEGNWVFGQDMKVDSETQKDTAARFGANLFLRAMFSLTNNVFAGADLGASFQEIRKKKDGSTSNDSKDKESKWFWGPAARLVLGVALTDNILATATAGGVFPVKQDHFNKDFKAKYISWNGGVGISYAFGG